jgi:acetate kinase
LKSSPNPNIRDNRRFIDCHATGGGASSSIDGLGFLEIELEEKPNVANEGVISSAAAGAAGRVVVRVIHTDEELMIARSVCRVLGPDAVNKKTEAST